MTSYPNDPAHRATAEDAARLAALDLLLLVAPERAAYAIRHAAQGAGTVYVPWDEANASGDPVGYAIHKWEEAQPKRAAEQTPEARFAVAHRKLADALEEFYRDTTEGTALLIDWTLVTAGHADLGNGTTATVHHIYTPEGAAAYRSLGLLEYGANYVRTALTQGGEQA